MPLNSNAGGGEAVTMDRYIYFDLMHGSCRLKIDTESNQLVSWSPSHIPLDQIAAAVQDRSDDAWLDWRAWVACRDVVAKRQKAEVKP